MRADLRISEEELLKLGEAEEVRGNLTFKSAVEVLPNTERTAELKRRKMELLRRRREEQENERRRKEQEEAQRRLKEQEAKKLKQQQELKKKEEERKRREEEEQRAKMEGGLDQLLGQLQTNQTPAHISICGIELGTVRLRLLAQALYANTSCHSLDLSRKGLTDEDGVFLAGMLKRNVALRKLELEGNNLGPKAAAAIADALQSNTALKSLNLESNNLTGGGQQHAGVIEVAKALGLRKSHLIVLNMSRNNIGQAAGAAFADTLDKNKVLSVLDLSANDLGVNYLRVIEEKIKRNREATSQFRRQERVERSSMFQEEYETRQYVMQVEALRLETEAIQERRLARYRDRILRWHSHETKLAQRLEESILELMNEYEERKAAKKGKKGKKGKK